METSITVWSKSNKSFLPVTQIGVFYMYNHFKIINPDNFKLVKISGRCFKVFSNTFNKYLRPDKIFVKYEKNKKIYIKELKNIKAHLYLNINKN